MANEKRLIDPKKALYLAEHSGLYDFDLSDLETLLFDEPCITVDAVEVVHGQWEERTKTGQYGIKITETVCSACGVEAEEITAGGGMLLLSEFCPHCGAIMDGVK